MRRGGGVGCPAKIPSAWRGKVKGHAQWLRLEAEVSYMRVSTHHAETVEP